MTERGRMIDAMGGEEGCRRLSESFYAHVSQEPELRPLFPGKSLRCATEEFSAFLVQFLGGDEEMTQYRWWLSLRESHARFRITAPQRIAWLRQMEITLRSSDLAQETQDALLQFFAGSSTYLLGDSGEPVTDPELAGRWKSALALDEFVANIVSGHDAEVLQSFGGFAGRPSLFVGILTRMLRTNRPALVRAVAEAIEHDPTLGTRKHAGRALIHNAAVNGSPEIVALLLNQGVDADMRDRGDHTPLYRLANECSAETGPEIVRILVRAGAEVNYNGGATRATPLHMAARRGYAGIARALLESGASVVARDTRGCTPLDRAVNCRKPEVVRLLRDQIANF